MKVEHELSFRGGEVVSCTISLCVFFNVRLACASL